MNKTLNWLKKLQEYYLTISNDSISVSAQLEVTRLWTIRNRNRNGWYSNCFQCGQRKTGNKKQTWKEIVIFPKVGCWYLFAQIATDVSALVIVCTFSRYEINPCNWPSTYLQYLDWLCTEAVVMNTAPPPTDDQLWKKIAFTAVAQNVLISKFKYWSM